MRKEIITQQNRLENEKEYDVEEIKREIEKEISEKGFSIFKVNPQRRLQFLYYVYDRKIYREEKIRDAHVVYFILTLIICIIFHIFLFFVFFVVLWFVFDTIRTIIKLGEKDIMSNFPGVKDEYSIMTKDYIFLNNKFRERKDFENRAFSLINEYYGEDYPGESEEIYRSLNRWNKQARYISSLIDSLSELEECLLCLKKLEKDIINELKGIEDGICDFDIATNSIKKIQTYIQKSLSLKMKAIKILEKSGFKKYINFDEFSLYLKNKFSFSVQAMERVLQRHIDLIQELQKNNKKFESLYIELATKRLKIYKHQLETQIQKLKQHIL